MSTRDATSYMDSAYDYCNQGEWDQAIASINQAIRHLEQQSPASNQALQLGMAYQLRAEARVGRKDAVDAIADYNEAIRLLSRIEDTRDIVARCYDGRGWSRGYLASKEENQKLLEEAETDLTYAIDMYEAAGEVAPAQFYYHRAFVYAEQKRYQAVRTNLTKAQTAGLSVSPEDWTALLSQEYEQLAGQVDNVAGDKRAQIIRAVSWGVLGLLACGLFSGSFGRSILPWLALVIPVIGLVWSTRRINSDKQAVSAALATEHPGFGQYYEERTKMKSAQTRWNLASGGLKVLWVIGGVVIGIAFNIVKSAFDAEFRNK